MKLLIFLLELLALLAGLLAWKRSRPAAIRTITLLMIFTVSVECYGQFFKTAPYPSYTMLVYNIFSFIEMSCWFYFFYQLYTTPVRRKIILFLGICYLAFAFVELFTYHNWRYTFHTDSYRLYSLCIIFLSVLYLWDLILRKEFHPLNKDGVFWLCAGALIFQSVFFVHLTVLNIPSFHKDMASIRAFNQLLDIANVLYYSLICVAYYTSWRLTSLV